MCMEGGGVWAFGFGGVSFFYWNLTNSPPITPNGLFSMICELFKILWPGRYYAQRVGAVEQSCL